MLGREAERARIEHSLDRVRAGGMVVALEGAPGIGKTTLWPYGVAGARARGYDVRST